jgi:hypothetical protein
MPRRDEQIIRDLDNYRQAVQDVAENVVAELADADTDNDRDELLTQLVHDRTDQHEYVINDELQIHTLLYSDHPCAGFFNGTFKSDYGSGDNFPFADFAADAFETDVTTKVKQLLEGCHA